MNHHCNLGFSAIMKEMLPPGGGMKGHARNGELFEIEQYFCP